MAEQDERAKFEAAVPAMAESLSPIMDSLERRDDGLYRRVAVEAAWKAWQARAAISTQAQPAAGEADSARLDFMLKKEAFVLWGLRDGSIRQCQLATQDEDERYWLLSGAKRFFNSEREAIDAALANPPAVEYL